MSRRAPRIAAVTNVAPPPRYSWLTAAGSPILRRAQVTSSSKTWVRMRSRSAAALKPISRASWSCAVRASSPMRIRPSTTTTSRGRRWPKTEKPGELAGAPDHHAEHEVVVGDLVRVRAPEDGEVEPDVADDVVHRGVALAETGQVPARRVVDDAADDRAAGGPRRTARRRCAFASGPSRPSRRAARRRGRSARRTAGSRRPTPARRSSPRR